jgi:histidinol-phosphate aminotransferase
MTAPSHTPPVSATVEAFVRDVIRDDIRALAAYHVQESAGMVKLDAMENPYALPEPLRQELGSLLSGTALNRYPDPQAGDLKSAIRGAMRIPADVALLLGNGSDEIIQMLAMAVARPGAVVLGVEPSFVMFSMIARFLGLEYAGVPLRADFSIDEAAVLKVVHARRPALAFFAYPNNPTGNLFDAGVLCRIIAASSGLVVVDEAYTAFADQSFLGQIGRHPNLVVMRTLSKLGLAGLRLGMLIGHPAWLAEIDKVRLPYNVNVLTQHAAARVLRNPEVLAAQTESIRTERTRLSAALARLPGTRVFPSAANFVTIRLPDAAGAFAHLRARGILVKNLDRAHPLLSGCLRLTVGTPDENDRLLSALGDILNLR